MTPMVACPDCGTSNRADADLCVQCWREVTAGAARKIPVVAFAATAPAPPAPPPVPGLAQPRRVPHPAPHRAPEPIAPLEAEPGPVPYFAPVAAAVAPAPSFPLPQRPAAPATTSSTGVPWGRVVALALVVALLGGGYHFFFGKSSGVYSPEDGSYSIELPDGWEPVADVADVHPQMDVGVGLGSSAVLVGHAQAPAPVSAEQMRAGIGYASQFVPQFPGMSSWDAQESTLLGEGVTAFEMTSSMDLGVLFPGAGRAKVRVVLAGNGSSTLVVLVVACPEAECTTANAAFRQTAQTLEFSS